MTTGTCESCGKETDVIEVVRLGQPKETLCFRCAKLGKAVPREVTTRV